MELKTKVETLRKNIYVYTNFKSGKHISFHFIYFFHLYKYNTNVELINPINGRGGGPFFLT